MDLLCLAHGIEDLALLFIATEELRDIGQEVVPHIIEEVTDYWKRNDRFAETIFH
jgi:hypothetical protein